jgi:hypothetical protein
VPVPEAGEGSGKELKKLGQSVEEVSDFARAGARREAQRRDRSDDAEGSGRGERGPLRGRAQLYLQAGAMDPADPAPVRYLAELLRHHTGQWDEARKVFQRLLAMRADRCRARWPCTGSAR